jgi:hypothetical protein
MLTLIALLQPASACDCGATAQYLGSDPAADAVAVPLDVVPALFYQTSIVEDSLIYWIRTDTGAPIPYTVARSDDSSDDVRVQLWPSEELPPDVTFEVGVGLRSGEKFQFTTGEGYSPAPPAGPSLAILSESSVDPEGCGGTHTMTLQASAAPAQIEMEVAETAQDDRDLLSALGDTIVLGASHCVVTWFGLSGAETIAAHARVVAPNGVPGDFGAWLEADVSQKPCGCRTGDPAGPTIPLLGAVAAALAVRARSNRAGRGEAARSSGV